MPPQGEKGERMGGKAHGGGDTGAEDLRKPLHVVLHMLSP